MKIRPAHPSEVDTLDRIALQSKAHWGYAPHDLATWTSDLRTPPATVSEWPTFVAELEGHIAGFAQADPTTEPWDLRSLWVLPSHMGRGVGRQLLRQVCAAAAASGQDRIRIDSDPNALGFYLACGARQVGQLPAPISTDSNRVRPQLELPSSGV